MRLNKQQKEYLLTLVAEGLKSNEINARAAKFKPPFEVSRAQVDFYRDSRGVKLQQLKDESESEALRTGLALKEGRVETLKELGDLLKKELLSGKLWLVREKAIGKGLATKFISEAEFNRTQINALRDVLDDIAKEMNARTYQRREAIPGDDTFDDEDLEDLTDQELEEIANGGA
jgi:hypothetical protein